MSTPAAHAGAARRRTKTGTRLWDLYMGEINPLVTNRANFWLVFSVTLLIAVVSMPFFYGFIAGYFVFAYAILPSFTTVFSALAFTKDRASGFASVVQTVPVSYQEYFLSKFLASMTLGGLFLALTLPFTGLAILYMGGGYLWQEFGKYLLFSIPLMMASTALGLFFSVIIGKRGLLASALTGFGVAVVFAAVGTFLRELRLEMLMAGPGGEVNETLYNLVKQLTNFSHLSPVVNAIDFAEGYGTNAEVAWKAVLTVLWIAAMLSAGGYFIYTRLQNVEGWDCPKWASIGAVAGVLVVAAAPAFVIDYWQPLAAPLPEPNENRQSMPFFFNGQLYPMSATVDPQTGCRAGCSYSYRSGEESPFQLRAGETRPYKLHMTFQPNGRGGTYTNIHVTFETHGNAEFRIRPDPIVIQSLTLGDSARGFVQVVNVTAVGIGSLGESFGYIEAKVQWNGREQTNGIGGFSVVQPSYKWYYPMYVFGAMAIAEAAPFVYRSRKIGKRGM